MREGLIVKCGQIGRCQSPGTHADEEGTTGTAPLSLCSARVKLGRPARRISESRGRLSNTTAA